MPAPSPSPLPPSSLVMFLYHLTSKHKAPEKQVELSTLKESAYDTDCKWADAVYEKDTAADPKAALAEHMAREPLVSARDRACGYGAGDGDACKGTWG